MTPRGRLPSPQPGPGHSLVGQGLCVSFYLHRGSQLSLCPASQRRPWTRTQPPGRGRFQPPARVLHGMGCTWGQRGPRRAGRVSHTSCRGPGDICRANRARARAGKSSSKPQKPQQGGDILAVTPRAAQDGRCSGKHRDVATGHAAGCVCPPTPRPVVAKNSYFSH